MPALVETREGGGEADGRDKSLELAGCIIIIKTERVSVHDYFCQAKVAT